MEVNKKTLLSSSAFGFIESFLSHLFVFTRKNRKWKVRPSLSTYFLLWLGNWKVMDGDKEKFGARVSEIAVQSGGQAELARRTGISTVTIASYINGKSEPSRERLIALAAAAKVSLLWLATGQGPKFAQKNGVSIGDAGPDAACEIGLTAQMEVSAALPPVARSSALREIVAWFNTEFAHEDVDREYEFRQEMREKFPAFESFVQRMKT